LYHRFHRYGLVAFHDGDTDAHLTKAQEVGAGVVGGTMACWNHPFEAGL
jgi:hypothetical protein